MAIEIAPINRRKVAPQEVMTNARLVVEAGRLANGSAVQRIGNHFRRMREFADFPVLVQTINRNIKDSNEISPEAKTYVRRVLRFLAKHRITNDAHNNWLRHPERLRMFEQKTHRHADDYGWRDEGPSI